MQHTRTTNTIGTMSHMPPEMLKLGKMSVSADVYAMGIMMWELYTGENAFHSLQMPGQFFETVVLQDLRPTIPQGMPADYQLLMQHCWATQPSARPSSSRVLECLEHMIRQRQQQQQMGLSTVAAGAGQPALAGSDQPPDLLIEPPPSKQQWQQGLETPGGTTSAAAAGTAAYVRQASFGKPPSATYAHSNSLLPVVDVEQPASSCLPYDAAQQLDQTLPELDKGARVNMTGSSGLTPLVQQFGASMRQDSLSLQDMPFDYRGTSWSGKREDSRAVGINDHNWFV